MLGRDKKSSKSAPTRDYRNHTLVARSATVRGDVEFTGGLHVQGVVEGNISVGEEGGRLVIGESGIVRGEIRVPTVVINGRVEGDVHATENLELAEKAAVEGNVYYLMIEMVMGARVNGKLVRLEEEVRNLPSPGKEKKSSALDEDKDRKKAGPGKEAADNT